MPEHSITNFLLCKEKTIFRFSGVKKGQHTLSKLKHCAAMKAIPECSGNNPSFKGTKCCSNKAEGQVLLSYVSSIGKRKVPCLCRTEFKFILHMGEGWSPKANKVVSDLGSCKELMSELSISFSWEVIFKI